jgi:hypothetical protein
MNGLERHLIGTVDCRLIQSLTYDLREPVGSSARAATAELLARARAGGCVRDDMVPT